MDDPIAIGETVLLALTPKHFIRAIAGNGERYGTVPVRYRRVAVIVNTRVIKRLPPTLRYPGLTDPRRA
jgi:hypothetical protein